MYKLLIDNYLKNTERLCNIEPSFTLKAVKTEMCGKG